MEDHEQIVETAEVYFAEDPAMAVVPERACFCLKAESAARIHSTSLIHWRY